MLAYLFSFVFVHHRNLHLHLVQLHNCTKGNVPVNITTIPETEFNKKDSGTVTVNSGSEKAVQN